MVDSGARMHMVSKRDLNSAELEIMRTLISPTTVMTANGEVQTREETTENVKELAAVKNHISSEMARELVAFFQLCTIYGSWIISEFFYSFTIFFTGVNIGEQRKHRY